MQIKNALHLHMKTQKTLASPNAIYIRVGRIHKVVEDLIQNVTYWSEVRVSRSPFT